MKTYSLSYLAKQSDYILNQLRLHHTFSQANTVLLFHSLADEVDTHSFIDDWSKSKNILLPQVLGEELVLHLYEGKESLSRGAYNIMEPQNKAHTSYEEIDLVVLPGVAFDKQGNRLGRGKGYYDRLLAKLSHLNIPTIGLCFDFQYVEEVPHESHDYTVDTVISYAP